MESQESDQSHRISIAWAALDQLVDRTLNRTMGTLIPLSSVTGCIFLGWGHLKALVIEITAFSLSIIDR